jgi:Xaa-Pro aminopeptidase
MPPDSRPPVGHSTLAERARKPPQITLSDTEGQIDMVALRAYRLGRVRDQLRRLDYAGVLLFDPINIRYATGSRNMAVWTLHNAARYCFVPTEGRVVLFDFHNCEHLSDALETIDEVRPTTTWFYFPAGPRVAERAQRWAAELTDLVRAQGGGNRRLALDHCDPQGAAALVAQGIELRDGQEVLELARHIKSAEELACMTAAISVCEVGMARMREALEPGMSENELWAILHHTNIALGGEWIETRLLSSGERTNPWFQESGDRVIRPGDLISYDTDLIGPFGYCADISRSHFCGPGRPSDEQRRLYRLAWEQIHHNMDLLKPGVSFRDLAEQAYAMPERFRPNRYSSLLHGVGLCDEYPRCAHLEGMERNGYDSVLEPGQTLITETGYELLSTFPFEEELLGREV